MPGTYNSVTVTTAATLIADVKNYRRGVIIFNGSNQTLFLGMDNKVTIANGMPVLANATFFNSGYLDLYRGAIYGIVTSSTADIRFWDWEEV
jgi:hypothetical protein